jgi:DNA-binding CsgD family transcriptional regulator
LSLSDEELRKMAVGTSQAEHVSAAVLTSVARAREARARAFAVRGYAGRGVRHDLEDARDLLRDGLAQPLGRIRRLELLALLAAEQRALDEHDELAHERARVHIYQALRRLRRSSTSEELVNRAPGELRQACGFTRAMISRVQGTRWFPDRIDVVDGVDVDADEFQRFAAAGSEIPLAHMLLETEMVRRRKPVIVEDAAGDRRTYKPLIRVTQSTSYVAAPIMAVRRVIGFLHADRLGQNTPVAPGDRDSVSLFAAHFGVLLARAVLAERIEGQRSALRTELHGAVARLDALCNAGIELGAEAPAVRLPAGRGLAAPMPQRIALLTPREREVLELLASGATNRAIASELVVSQDTVKSHVSGILRKFGASSRAQAVANYVELVAHEARRPAR